MSDEIQMPNVHVEQVDSSPTEPFSPAEVVRRESVEEESQPEVQEDSMSTRFAALARREKMLQERERKLKEEFEGERSKRQSEADKYARYDSLKERFETDPLAVMEEHGWSYDQLTDRILGAEDRTDFDPKAEIEALREELKRRDEDASNQAEEQLLAEEEAQVEQYLNDYRGQVQKVVEQDRDKYELVHLNNAQEEVLNVAAEYYKTHQQLISAEQAADLVEDYFTEEARKMLGTKKLGQYRESLNIEDRNDRPTVEATKPVISREPPRTLTQNLAGNNPIPQPTSGRNLTEDASKKEAAKLLKWK